MVTMLIFTAIFTMLLGSLMGYVLSVKKARQGKEAQEHALTIAEAGLSYYKWRLAHFPNNFTDGTGQPGPYLHTFNDPEGGAIGTSSIAVSTELACGNAQSVIINSTGIPEEAPYFTRTVSARYARPSVAAYAYIIDSNVWAGDDRVITGPYHANGGIRMDGDNRSTVTSEQSQWYCDNSFGCSQWGEYKPGVFGAGDHPEFWKYPAAHIDFGALAVSFPSLRTTAQTYGVSLANYSGSRDSRGYHLILRNDRTVDVYRVLNTQAYTSYGVEGAWRDIYERMLGEQYVGRYTIPAGCGLIYVDDRIWIEGTVKGKVTVVTADADNPVSGSYDAIIVGNITYASSSGEDGLTLIAQRDVLLPLVVPDTLTMNGIFIAQNGTFGRRHYITYNDKDHAGNEAIPGNLDSYIIRSSLTVRGTIVSKLREGSQWVNGWGTIVSGFQNRNNSYDRALAASPPPLTPFTSTDYQFMEWKEER